MDCSFREIGRCWGVFWIYISYSLYNTCLIYEGAIHLHNFLVDYRISLDDPRADKVTEKQIFDYDRLDNTITSSLVTSDTVCPRERPYSEEITCRMNGLLLRDHLRQSFHNNNIHRPTKDYNKTSSYDIYPLFYLVIFRYNLTISCLHMRCGEQ